MAMARSDQFSGWYPAWPSLGARDRGATAFQYCSVSMPPFPASSIEETTAEPHKSAVVLEAAWCNSRIQSEAFAAWL
jgi:hypothetical protein